MVSLLTTGMLLGSLYATRDTTAAQDRGAAAYLPQDGSREVVRKQGLTTVTENALLPATVAAFSMPGKVNTLVVAKHGDLIASGVAMWRQTTTYYGGSPAQAAALFAVTERGLVQLAFASDQLQLVFDPPVLVLPDRPENGRTWTDSGDALAGLVDYTSRSKVARSGRCWRTEVSVDFTEHASKKSLGTIPGDSRICPGRGILEGTTVDPPRPTTTGPQVADPKPLRGLTSAAVLPLVSTGPAGDLTIGAFRLDVAPVPTGDQRMVLADANSDDLVSTRRDGQRLLIGWRAHPGGTITSLNAVGEVVLVGTSNRDVCAYDADGAWLWCRELGDLADRPGVALDDRTLAVLGQDGVLRALDVLTGAVRWRVRGVDSALPPVRVGAQVVVAERSGTLRAWRARDGRRTWATETADVPQSVTTTGEELVVIGERVSRYDGTGREVARHVLRTSFARASAVGTTTVVSSSDGTAAFARSGERLWSAPTFRTAYTDGSSLLTVQDGSARLLDPATGQVARSWPLKQRGGSWWVVPLGDHVLLVHSGAEVVGLS